MDLHSNLTLSSPDLKGQACQEQIFNGEACRGLNISPQLDWTGAPAYTRSFAITMYDRDAPSGSGWWHWVVMNLPATVAGVVKNAGDLRFNLMPEGVIQVRNDFGLLGYCGPCPPPGDGIHEYMITVYALDIPKIDLPEDINPAKAGFQINAHTLQKASLVMYYQRFG